MTDLERAVKAAFCAEFSAGNYYEGPLADKYRQGLFNADIIRIERCVRAAIEALMEPSASAAIAGARSLRDTFNNPNQIPRARACLQAILRAVLEGR